MTCVTLLMSLIFARGTSQNLNINRRSVLTVINRIALSLNTEMQLDLNF